MRMATWRDSAHEHEAKRNASDTARKKVRGCRIMHDASLLARMHLCVQPHGATARTSMERQRNASNTARKRELRGRDHTGAGLF